MRSTRLMVIVTLIAIVVCAIIARLCNLSDVQTRQLMAGTGAIIAIVCIVGWLTAPRSK